MRKVLKLLVEKKDTKAGVIYATIDVTVGFRDLLFKCYEEELNKITEK
jgi:hypothetical protein